MIRYKNNAKEIQLEASLTFTDALFACVTIDTLALAVCLQVAGDVGRAQELPADVARHLAFVAHHVCPQSVFGGKGSSARRHEGGKLFLNIDYPVLLILKYVIF